MASIYHLLYPSVASGFVSEKVVQEILRVSHPRNERAGLTGLLQA